MAKKKEEPPPGVLIDEVHGILDRVNDGDKMEVRELQLAAAAAAGLRRSWLAKFGEQLPYFVPATPEFEAFKAWTKDDLSLLVRHGFISGLEAMSIWREIEIKEAGR